jgi:hypothetical protein
MRYLLLVCLGAGRMDAQTERDPTDTPDEAGFHSSAAYASPMTRVSSAVIAARSSPCRASS